MLSLPYIPVLLLFFNQSSFEFLFFFKTEKWSEVKSIGKRLFEPNVVHVVASREFNVLQKLQRRMADDMEQSEIIMNYLADKYGEPEKKRVKFSTLQ